MATVNPYLAPDADLFVESTGISIEKVKQLPRFTTWAVFGLAMITMGIYPLYWLTSRTKILNKLLPENKIPAWLPMTTLITYLVYFTLAFAPLAIFAMGGSPEIMAMVMGISSIASIIYFILYLVCVYGFRKRLNILSESTKGNQFWLGGILTFFINVLYLQYKINQMHDQS